MRPCTGHFDANCSFRPRIRLRNLWAFFATPSGDFAMHHEACHATLPGAMPQPGSAPGGPRP